LSIDSEGRIFIADTWNQRIQVFVPDFANLRFTYLQDWEVVGWYGQSLDNKPYLATDYLGNVFVSDPEGYRILHFDSNGKFIQYWGELGTDLLGLNLPTGISADNQGNIWVVDSGNHRLLRFPPPTSNVENDDT
jgi:sugar lactone lactonase YvrE